MVDVVKGPPNVGIDYPSLALVGTSVGIDALKGVMAAASRAEPVTEAEELLLVDRIEHSGRNHADGRLAHSAPEIMAGHDHGFDLGHLGKAHDLISVEIQVDHASIFHPALTVERCGQSIGD